MNCFICGAEAQLSERPDSEEYQCPNCGHYEISRTALELYKQRLWKFDVYLARRWIADQQDSDAIPFVDLDIAVRLLGD